MPAIAWHTVRDCIAEVGCFPRARHRDLRQDRVRREALDADRGRGSLRAVPRRPRLVLDHAAEAQPDFLGLHHRAHRRGAPAGRRLARCHGRGPRARHRPLGDRVDRAAGNFLSYRGRAGADRIRAQGPAGRREKDARQSRPDQGPDRLGGGDDGSWSLSRPPICARSRLRHLPQGGRHRPAIGRSARRERRDRQAFGSPRHWRNCATRRIISAKPAPWSIACWRHRDQGK